MRVAETVMWFTSLLATEMFHLRLMSRFFRPEFDAQSGQRSCSSGRPHAAHHAFSAPHARRNRPARLRQRKPLGDPHQHRQPDLGAVCDRRLFGLPARSRSPDARARRDRRPATRERRPGADAHHTRASRGSSPRRCGRSSCRTARRIRGSSTSARPARIRIARSSACRSSTVACCRACSSSRPPSRGPSATTTCGCWRWRARSWRRSSARRARSGTSSRRCTSGWPRSPRTCGGRGTRRPSASSATLDPVLWRDCDHNPIALLQQTPVGQLEARASELALHGRINHAYRRMQEYLQSKHTWGARHASVLGARPVAYFSAEFGLHESMPIYSGGLGILAGDHLKSASDLGIPLVGDRAVLRPGLLPAAARRATAGSRRITSTSTAGSCRFSRRSAGGVPVTGRDRDADRAHRRARVADRRGPQHAPAARLERRRQQPGRPRADGAAVRR